MKVILLSTSIFLLFFIGYANAQDTTLIDFQLPEKSEIVDVRFQDKSETLTGHLYQATPDELSILKSKQPAPGEFELVNIPVQNLKRISFKNQKEKDHFSGAVIGFCVGAIAGILWASTIDVPECENPFLWSCDNSEERQDAWDKQGGRLLRASLIGTSVGALVGTNVRLTFPIFGNQSKYENQLVKIKQFAILKE